VLLPIKVELQQQVFEKTSVSREHPPKVTLERLRMWDRKKDEFTFIRAYEQMKDLPASLLRPPKP